MVDVSTIIPDEIFGVPTLPLIGLVIGIILAVSEATRTKYLDYSLKLKMKGEEITFDNVYIIPAITGVVVVALTVISVKDAGIIKASITNDLAGFFTVMMAGFTEGWAVIRTLNKRLDYFIKKKAMQCGATEEQAQEIADAVKFVEVDAPNNEPKSDDKPKGPASVSFEEL